MTSESATSKGYRFTPESNMTIPSYEVKMGSEIYKTKPIKIIVNKASTAQTKENNKFHFTLVTDKTSLFVGESLVVTMALSISDTLRGVQLSEYVAPSAKAFFIKEVEGQKEYRKNGFSVIEKQYIMTAKKEGNFSINAAHAKFGIPDRRRQDIFGRYGVRWVPKQSNKLSLEVKPMKVDTDLLGDFKLNKKIDTQSVKANKPVNLKVNIIGEGNLEDFTYEKYEIDGVTIYSDDAKVESSIKNVALQSSYNKSFVFISDTDFTIPARSIKMYNPRTKETRTLEVPSYEIKVAQAKASIVSSVAKGKVQHNSTKALSLKKPTKKSEVSAITWWMLLLSFGFGALTMYLISFLSIRWKREKKTELRLDALQILYGHIGEDPEVEIMVRKLYAKKSGDTSVEIDKKALNAMLKKFKTRL